jgi:ABC-2 type transport system permease protein
MFWMSPIAYIVLTVFLAVVTWLFLATFFIQENGSLQGLFSMLPMAFVLVIPALTMRQWAEEKKSGTVELLMTKPVTEWEVVMGKYLATAAFLLVLLLLTLPLSLTIHNLAQNGLDSGVLFTSYLGALLLGLMFLAVGSWVSAMTENQIVAFILGVLGIFFFTIIGNISVLFAAKWTLLLEYIGVSTHYSTLARGVVDTRDLVYFAAMVFLFLYLTTRTVESRKWS